MCPVKLIDWTFCDNKGNQINKTFHHLHQVSREFLSSFPRQRPAEKTLTPWVVPPLSRRQEELAKRFFKFDDSSDCRKDSMVIVQFEKTRSVSGSNGKWRSQRRAAYSSQMWLWRRTNVCKQKLQVEMYVLHVLNTFHTSYECSRNDANGMLDTTRKHSSQDILPTLLYCNQSIRYEPQLR